MSDGSGGGEADGAGGNCAYVVGVADSGDNRVEQVTLGRGAGGEGSDEHLNGVACCKGLESGILLVGAQVVKKDGHLGGGSLLARNELRPLGALVGGFDSFGSPVEAVGLLARHNVVGGRSAGHDIDAAGVS